MTLTDVEMLAMISALVDTGGPWDPAAVFVGVGTAVADGGAATARADITAAAGTAGTATAVTAWSDPHKMVDGRWAVDSGVKTFAIATSDDACTLTVWYLATLAVAGDLIGFGLVEPAVELVDEFSLYSLVVRLTIDPDGRWSSEIQWNG